MRASQLPDGTIVVISGHHYERVENSRDFPWESDTSARRYSDAGVDDEVDSGADVILNQPMTTEPENGSYMAVHTYAGTGAVWVLQRDDGLAFLEGQPDRHWVLASHVDEHRDYDSYRTWAEVCRLGPVAYVGVFIDRGGEGGN